MGFLLPQKLQRGSVTTPSSSSPHWTRSEFPVLGLAGRAFVQIPSLLTRHTACAECASGFTGERSSL